MSLMLSAIVFAAVLGSANPAPWTEAGTTDGVKVWYRDHGSPEGREIKAEYVIAASPERVWAVLSDVDRYLEFMPYLVELRKFEPFANGYHLYEVISPPVIDRRDYTLRMVVEEDAKAHVYRRRWTPANEKAPPLREDTIRVEVNEGAWTLEPHEHGTRVTYELFTHPGGSIPTWIARRANTSSVPNLLKALEKRVLHPEWKRD